MPAAINPEAWRRGWFGKLAPYDTETDDARILEPFSIACRQLPLPLSLQIESKPGHMGSVVVGTIKRLVSTDSGVFASGTWLDPAAVAEVNRAIALTAAGIARPSLDLVQAGMVAKPETGDDGRQVTRYFAAKSSGATMVAVAAFDGTFIRLGPEDGTEIEEAMRELAGAGFDGDMGVIPSKEQGQPAVFALSGTTSWRNLPIASRDMPFNRDDAVARILAWANGNEAKLRSMFLVIRPEYNQGTQDRYVFPIGDVLDKGPHLVFHAIYSAAAILNGAHGGAKGISDAERQRLMGIITEIYQRMSTAFQDPNLQSPWAKRARLPENSRTASAGVAPVAPPAAWFETPEPDRPTRITVTADGRIFGHLAAKGTCHVGLGQLTGECVTPPISKTGYQVFHTGTVLTREGRQVQVGRVTMDTTHPVGASGASLTAAAAARHYDNTGACAAVVRASDGRHGIWLSGALVPEAGEEVAARLRRHPLSGDWRRVGGNLELVAALAVNSPGFPVFGIDDDGNREVLVASAAAGCLEESATGTIDDMGIKDDNGTGGTDAAPTTESTAGAEAGEQSRALTSGPTEPVVAKFDPEELRALVDAELTRRQEQQRLSDELDGIILGDWSELSSELDKLGPLEGES